jgi:hypothetical protein
MAVVMEDEPSILNLSGQLCRESGEIRRVQMDLVRLATSSASRIRGLTSNAGPPSSAVQDLIAEYETTRKRAKMITDWIYTLQRYGYEMGLTECTDFMRGKPNSPRGLGAVPAGLITTLCAATGGVPCAIVIGGIAIASIVGLVYVIQLLIEAFNAAEITYRKTLDEQYKVVREVCDKALQDPSYLKACSEAQEKLRQMSKERPPTLLQQLLPIGIAAVVTIGGVALIRSAMKNAARRRAAEMIEGT